MSYLLNNQQKFNELIFANRNKNYGAYVLRSGYGTTILKSLSIVILSFCSLMSLAFYVSNRNNPETDKSEFLVKPDSIIVIPFKPKTPDVIDPPEQDNTTASPKNKSTTNSFIIRDSVAVQNTSVATTPTSSAVTDSSQTSLPNNENSTSTITNAGTRGSEFGIKDTSIKSFVEIDSEPVFEGGLKALHEFIASHVRYPQQAAELGEQGIVYVKFVVDENGKVGRLSLLNSVGYGMDDEALRVIGQLPKFKSPAKVRGEAVKVYYQMPIRFRMK